MKLILIPNYIDKQNFDSNVDQSSQSPTLRPEAAKPEVVEQMKRLAAMAETDPTVLNNFFPWLNTEELFQEKKDEKRIIMG